MLKYYILYLLSVIITVISQLLLKTGARMNQERHWLYSYFNLYTISGYFLLFLTTLMTLIVLKYMPLKMTIFFAPMNYILLLFLTFIFLKEKVGRIQLFGIITIIAGIIIYSL